MSISINLLPDTRLAKHKSGQRRKLATALAIALWIICGATLVLLFLSVASEKLIIGSLNKSIAEKKSKLDNTPGIIEALTAQEHLKALPGLYTQRVYLTKFFETYSQANPGDISLSSLSVDPQNIMTVSGSAGSYASVAKLAKALEAKKGTDGSSAFGAVTIKDVSKVLNAISFSLSATVQGGTTSGN